MERAVVSAITHDQSEAKLTIAGVPDEPGVAANVFRQLADANVNVDMIVQNVSDNGRTDISFTAPRVQADTAEQILRTLSEKLAAEEVVVDNIGRVSLVGAGMKSNPGVAARMFETLADNDINIEMISTSAIRISCVVADADAERAVVVLHEAFELEKAAP